MDKIFREEFDAVESLLRELAKRHKSAYQETSQLHSLVAAMESDYKKASRLLNEHEKMLKERERAKDKIGALLVKLEELRIS
ncbi:MAG: hypothetical protein AAB091_04225 [Elusimicrobiota bacterium]